jgi:hypothetical protein
MASINSSLGRWCKSQIQMGLGAVDRSHRTIAFLIPISHCNQAAPACEASLTILVNRQRQAPRRIRRCRAVRPIRVRWQGPSHSGRTMPRTAARSARMAPAIKGTAQKRPRRPVERLPLPPWQFKDGRNQNKKGIIVYVPIIPGVPLTELEP